MPTPTRTRHGAVREALLVAGREVFFYVGYQDATLADVADHAGLSTRAAYATFADKDDLLLSLLARELSRIREVVVTTVIEVGDRTAAPGSGETTLARDLRLLAKALLTVAGEGRAQLVFAEFRAHAVHDVDLATRTAVIRAGLVEDTAAQLADVVRERGHRLAVPARDAAVLVLALINGLVLEQVGRADEVTSVASLAAVLGGLIVSG